MGEWKPGDVAMVMSRGGDSLIGIRVPYGWEFGTGDLRDSDIEDVRPLVVIDPEDREQVERLVEAMGYSIGTGARVDDTQEALRSLAQPEPDEPMNDGALVECNYDGKHGRAVRLGGSWTFYGEALRDGGAIYGEFTAVRVLSEGVTP